MARYFIEVAYDGTPFVGWQRQATGRTVQGLLDDALTMLAQKPVKTMGSGRTDQGVHAAGQAAHFDLDASVLIEPDKWLYRLNAILPPEISCLRLFAVPPRHHARFSAISRTYTYHLTFEKNPFTAHCCTYWPVLAADVHAMQEAAGYLLGEHSFRSFSKNVPGEHYLCRVEEAVWELLPPSSFLPYSGPVLRFRVTANRFLRGQVRAMVGAMLEVGKGKQAPVWIKELLEAQQTQVPSQLAAPQGLCLAKVAYPPIRE